MIKILSIRQMTFDNQISGEIKNRQTLIACEPAIQQYL